MLDKKNSNSWVRYIQKRISQNKNFLCFISGPTGSGKSWSSLAIGEAVDPEFTIERVVFNGRELMSLINSDKLRSGSCIVFEEAGVGLSSRNWQSTTNKMLNFLVQTFRHRNFILIFNSPYMDFVDASTRRLFHAEFRTISIDFKECRVKLKPQLLQYNSRLQKFYYKHLRVITDDGVLPIVSWNVGKPSQELLDAYETRKREFTDKLNREIQSELEEANNKGKELTATQEAIVKSLESGLKPEEIAKERNVNPSSVYRSMQLIKKKGYDLTPIKRDKEVLHYEVSKP